MRTLEGWKGKFKYNCIWEVGNGRKIRLWKDKWVGNTSLKVKFPRLFTICSLKESYLWQGGVRKENLKWAWKIDWRKNLFEWEKN